MNATASFSGRKGGFDTLPAVVSLSVGSYVGGRKMKFHYTYKLIAVNPIDERVEYIGVRSCSGLPADDAAYMSSSREIRALIKSGVQFVKEIIAVHENRKKAVAHEVELHADFDVARSPRFFNKAKQTAVGFDTQGTLTGEDNCMANPVVRAKHAKIVSDLDYREKVSNGVRRAFSNPEVAARVNAAKAIGVRTEKARKKISVSSRRAMSNPETKLKHSAATSAALLSPMVNAKLRAAHRANWAKPGVKEARSAKLKRAYERDQTLRYRVSHNGESNGMFGKNHSDNAIRIMADKRKKCAALKSEYCIANGISNPGKAYSNIDKADFARWLATNKKEAA